MKFSFNEKIFTVLTILSHLPIGVFAQSKVRRIEIGGKEGEWIVVMKNKQAGSLSTLSAELLANTVPGVKKVVVYSSAINAFYAEMPNEAANILSENILIDYVEQNAEVRASDLEDLWGLDRVDQRDLPLDQQTFSPDDGKDGSGVTAFIIDTGININHVDFGDRARHGFNAFDGQETNEDCHGHGSHVAGTVGGSTYGVATNVNLVAVKVLNCGGSGSTDSVIQGIDWVMSQKNNDPDLVATANLSLGGPVSTSLNDAVKSMHEEAGIPTVVAAGNEKQNACNVSPAMEPSVITVGSIQSDDMRSGFSNWGPCLNIFAPGSDIKSAFIGESNTETRIWSGTSMASPHVAGAVALLLQSGTPSDDVAGLLIGRATGGKITDEGPGSPNKLLFVGTSAPTPSPTPYPPTPSPTPCPESSLTVAVTTDNYPLETSWQLFNDCTENIELSILEGYYTIPGYEYSQTMCIPSVARYTFKIDDSYNDGICCGYGDGSYKVTIDGEVKASGGVFGSAEETSFGACTIETTEAPIASIEPTASPTTAPICPESSLTVVVTTDDYPLETSWQLLNDCTENIDLSISQGNYTIPGYEYSQTICIPSVVRYTFKISDEFNDGICCTSGNGIYRVSIDGEVKASGGLFGSVDEKTFGTCFIDPTTAPTKVPTEIPTGIPTKMPSDMPSTAPTILPTNAPTECIPFVMNITTDNFPEETTWSVNKGCSDEIILSGGPYDTPNSNYTESGCLAPGGSYTFTMNDSHGDGICCDVGNGKFTIQYGEEIITENEPRFRSELSRHLGDTAANTFELTLKTDNKPRETFWQLLNRCTGSIELSTTPGFYRVPLTEYTITKCIPPDGAYTFTIYDSNGDGLCCNDGIGSYSVKYGGEILSDTSTAFSGDSMTTNWGSGNCDVGGGANVKSRVKEPIKVTTNKCKVKPPMKD